MFRFAHLSDVHLPPPGAPRLSALRFKQVLSFLSWRIQGQRRHCQHVIEAGLRALRGFTPEHVCVTGDLVSLALPEEISQAAGWLRALGTFGMTCSLVPGNHDALVRPSVAHYTRAWAPWMGAGAGPATFPYVVQRGPVAFIGLSSALPTPPGMAWGEVDREQVEALEPLLHRAAVEKRFRVLLVHHCPTPGSDSPRRGLRRPGPLLAVLRRQGAELVLHGHRHRVTQTTLAGPNGTIPAYGAGSFSRSSSRQGRSGHFFGFCLDAEGPEFQLRVHQFEYQSTGNAFTMDARDGRMGPFP